MTDFRAELQALIDVIEQDVNGTVFHDFDADNGQRFQQALDRANAALAQQEGEGPSSAELMAAMGEAVAAFPPRHPEAEKLCAVEYEIELEVRKARAVYARFGRPAPQPVADGEVGELVAELRGLADYFEGECYSIDWVNQLTRAADLLEHHHPQPIPVSERLPGPGDCDAEGRCWWFCPPDFMELRSHATAESAFVAGATHWRPFSSLPLPTTTETTDEP